MHRSGRARRRLATLVIVVLSVATSAADPTPSGADSLRMGRLEDGRVVVSPGLPMAKGEDYQTAGAAGCTSGFLLGDGAYIDGRAGGQRYLLTVAGRCTNVEAWGDLRQWRPGEGTAVHLAPRNPAVVLPAAGIDQRGEAIGRVVWADQRLSPADTGTGFLYLDVAVVLLDRDVSVDPDVPGLGVPEGIVTEFRSVATDGTAADVLRMFGRGAGTGDVMAQRQGQVLGQAGGTHLCLAMPMSDGDNGAPVLDAMGRAAAVVTVVSGSVTASPGQEPCASAALAVPVREVLHRFHESTGVELFLLTEPAGPILPDP